MLNLYSIVEKDLAWHFGQILQATEGFTGSNNKEVVQKKEEKKNNLLLFTQGFCLNKRIDPLGYVKGPLI